MKFNVDLIIANLARRAKEDWEYMELDVRFFALYRDRAGCSHSILKLPQGATVADLTAEVRRRFPSLAPSSARIVVAVNAEYAAADLALNQGDEVCLIPPVSGG
jgi:molybdopterin converting factor subunit 1